MGVMAIWGARVYWALSPGLSPTHTQSGGLKTLSRTNQWGYEGESQMTLKL